MQLGLIKLIQNKNNHGCFQTLILPGNKTVKYWSVGDEFFSNCRLRLFVAVYWLKFNERALMFQLHFAVLIRLFF